MDSEPEDSEPPPAYTSTTDNPTNHPTSLSKRYRGSNQTFCRRLLKVIKSLGGQTALLLAYTFLGAWMMMTIEGPLEDSQRQEVSSARERTWWLLKNRTLELQAGLINHTEWDSQTNNTLLEFESQVHQSGTTSTSKKKWTFFGSVLFCFTTYTTIGYGNIAPTTKAGRIATMLYATLGIPLALIVLADLGRRFAIAFKFLWGFLRRYYYTGYCRKVRNKVNKASYDMPDASSPAGDCERGHDDPLDIQRQGSYRKVDSAGALYREEKEGGGGDVGSGGKPPDGGGKVKKVDEVKVEENVTQLQAGQSHVNEVSGKTLESVDVAHGPDKAEGDAECSKQTDDAKVSSEHTQHETKSKESTSDHKESSVDHTDHADHTEIHDEYKLPVPVAVGFIFAYIFLGAGMYTIWEDWTYLESFYFVFVTTSTLGFGDVLPEHPNFFLLSCVYTFLGLALVSMTVNVIMEFMAKTIDLAKDSVDSAAEKAVAKAKAAGGKLVKVGSRAKNNIRKTIHGRKKKSKKAHTSSTDNGIEVKDGSHSGSDSDVPKVRVGDAVLATGESSEQGSDNVKDVNPQSHDRDKNGGDRIPSVETVSPSLGGNRLIVTKT